MIARFQIMRPDFRRRLGMATERDEGEMVHSKNSPEQAKRLEIVQAFMHEIFVDPRYKRADRAVAQTVSELASRRADACRRRGEGTEHLQRGSLALIVR